MISNKIIKQSIIICFLLISLPIYAVGLTEEEARDWCDNTPLTPIEGIWEYPEDNTRVLIQKDKDIPGTFTLTVISTPDCRMMPGEVIGRLHPSVDSRQYRLEQFTNKDKNILSNTSDCTAILSTDGESIRVKTKKFKVKINATTLLPRFWRLVRISVNNPVDDLPAGMVKIYPGYDHNGSLRRKVRIL